MMLTGQVAREDHQPDSPEAFSRDSEIWNSATYRSTTGLV